MATPGNVYVVSFFICNIRGENRGVFRITPSAGTTKKKKKKKTHVSAYVSNFFVVLGHGSDDVGTSTL